MPEEIGGQIFVAQNEMLVQTSKDELFFFCFFCLLFNYLFLILIATHPLARWDVLDEVAD